MPVQLPGYVPISQAERDKLIQQSGGQLLPGIPSDKGGRPGRSGPATPTIDDILGQLLRGEGSPFTSRPMEFKFPEPAKIDLSAFEESPEDRKRRLALQAEIDSVSKTLGIDSPEAVKAADELAAGVAKRLRDDSLTAYTQLQTQRGLKGSSAEAFGTAKILADAAEKGQLAREGLLQAREQAKLSRLSALQSGLSAETGRALQQRGLLSAGVQAQAQLQNATQQAIAQQQFLAQQAEADRRQNLLTSLLGAQLRSQELDLTRQEILMGQKQAKKEKKKSKFGDILAVGGLLAAPFTGGASTALTGSQAAVSAAQHAATGGTFAFCWVAAEVFDGWLKPETINTRKYMLLKAPKDFRDMYIKYGEQFADLIRRNPSLKKKIKPLFEIFAKEGGGL